MIEWVVGNVRPGRIKAHFTFLVSQEHLRTYPVQETLERIAPGCSVVPVPGTTEGAACTVLLAVDEIELNRPLLLANSDQLVNVSIDAFLAAAETSGDGLIMTFPATDKKWSYAALDRDGRVERVAEKDPISPHATVGIYYFRRGADFFRGAREMIRKDIRVNGEFYVCPVYNEVIGHGGRIGIHSIDAARMHGLGTPEDLQAFLRKSESEDTHGSESSLAPHARGLR